MTREHYLARVFRALSGQTQGETAAAIGVHPSLIAQIEQGQALPSGEHLSGMAQAAGLTVEQGDEILHRVDTLRRGRRRRGQSVTDLLDDTSDRIRVHFQAVFDHLLTLPLPDFLPKPEDREGVEELFAELVPLSWETRSAVVRISERFQGWALCERACAESKRVLSQDRETAEGWARLAQEIASRARGPQDWRDRLQGYAAAHAAQTLESAGAEDPAEQLEIPLR